MEQDAGRDYQYVVATRDITSTRAVASPRPRTSRTASPSAAWPETKALNSTPTSHLVVTDDKVHAVLFKGAHSASKSGLEGADAEGTSPADWLRVRGVEDVDVVGIATDHCVRATALDAVAAGFRPRVRLEYSVGVAPHTTSAALNDFRQAGIAVSGEAPVPQSVRRASFQHHFAAPAG